MTRLPVHQRAQEIAPKMLGGSRLEDVAEKRFLLLALIVVCLASTNLFARLGLETVTEWDESLYVTSAAEMLQNGQWAATTFEGRLDYFNSKPPLNVWLIATSFKLFGVNLWSMRLPSAFAGLATVILLMWWLRHAFDAATALGAGPAVGPPAGASESRSRLRRREAKIR